MEQIQLVEGTATDIPTIRNLAMAIWPVAYGRILHAGQLEYMLANFYSPLELQKQLDNKVQFLIAYQQKKAIAFAGFGPQENGDYKLQKLYVLPGVQKTGAGKLLLKEVIHRSKHAGAERLILNVHRSNPAKSFYEKFGFRIYETIDIPFGPGFVLNDYLMEKLL